MSYLYQVLTERVDAWRAANYPCDQFPAIREILEFATEDGEAGSYILALAVKIIDMLGEELVVRLPV